MLSNPDVDARQQFRVRLDLKLLFEAFLPSLYSQNIRRGSDVRYSDVVQVLRPADFARCPSSVTYSMLTAAAGGEMWHTSLNIARGSHCISGGNKYKMDYSLFLSLH